MVDRRLGECGVAGGQGTYGAPRKNQRKLECGQERHFPSEYFAVPGQDLDWPDALPLSVELDAKNDLIYWSQSTTDWVEQMTVCSDGVVFHLVLKECTEQEPVSRACNLYPCDNLELNPY